MAKNRIRKLPVQKIFKRIQTNTTIQTISIRGYPYLQNVDGKGTIIYQNLKFLVVSSKVLAETFQIQKNEGTRVMCNEFNRRTIISIDLGYTKSGMEKVE